MVAFSIIIPCYNIQTYITKAVDSIIKQSVQNFEIILVNDGSTDNSLNVIQTLALNENRIKIINKNNGGLSSARNSGLEIAKGEYILFLDGDDWLQNDTLNILYNKAKTENLDVLIADTLFYFTENRIEWTYKRPPYFKQLGILNGVEYFIELKKSNCYAPMAYNQIYNTKFLKSNKLLFYNGLINEDELWTPQILLKAQRVNCIEFPFYCYLQRDNSIMNSKINPKKIFNNIFIANSLINLIKNQKNKELKSWMWVKSYELYYRAIIEYKAPEDILKQTSFKNFTIVKLLISGISEEQFDLCLNYLKSANNDRYLKYYLLLKKIFRRMNKILSR